MRGGAALRGLAWGITFTGTLAGCAAYRAERRCAATGCPEDVRVTAEVRALVNQHTELLAPNAVYVNTLDGVVYLTGQVATDLQRETAESLARQVAGVRGLNDNIALGYRGGP